MKKLLGAFIVSFLFFLSASPSFAQSTWVDPSSTCHIAALDKGRGWENCFDATIKVNGVDTTIQEVIDANCSSAGKPNMQSYLNASSDELMYSFAGKIGGQQTFCPSDDPRVINLQEQTFIGSTSKFIGYLYDTPAASFSYYAQDLMQNAGFAKPAYAQGIGYAGLTPILPIWKAFRNLSYVILVVVLVAIGFMIMFRMKLDAQTVVTIQSAIPNIIITLVLITFSYAIAGLMIDLMYFLINLIVSVFVNAGLGRELNGVFNTGDKPINIVEYQEYYTNANTWDLMNSVINWETVMGLPNALWRGGIGGLAERFTDAWGTESPGRTAELFVTLVAGFIINVPGGALLSLLIGLGLLFIFVRLFFIFLNSYIQILLSIILAPLQLLVGAVPGQNMFRNWIMGLIGNLIVFPAAVALFMLNLSISVFAFQAINKGETSLWTPPFLLGRPEGSSINAATPIALIGFGILMLTPTLLTTVKGLFAPKPFLPITPGLVVGPIVGAGSTTLQQLAQLRYAGEGIKAISGIGFLRPFLQRGGGKGGGSTTE